MLIGISLISNPNKSIPSLSPACVPPELEAKKIWTYYIRLDIKMRDLELHKLTLNYEKTTQKLQSIL